VSYIAWSAVAIGVVSNILKHDWIDAFSWSLWGVTLYARESMIATLKATVVVQAELIETMRRWINLARIAKEDEPPEARVH
jgi:hypothetical protein